MGDLIDDIKEHFVKGCARVEKNWLWHDQLQGYQARENTQKVFCFYSLHPAVFILWFLEPDSHKEHFQEVTVSVCPTSDKT